MFRVNAASLIAKRASFAVANRVAATRPSFVNMMRFYSTPSGLVQQDVEDRIVKVFRAFDKIEDPSKITPTANFSTELGLDSLDTVEVIVAVEEEFGIEIPDAESDEIKSVSDAVQYILAQPEGK